MLKLLKKKTLALAGLTALSSAAAFAQLNAPFTLVGNATSLGNDCYNLTTCAAGNSQKSAIWYPNTINLQNPFDLTFHIQLEACGNDPYFAADGMAFVLQSVGTGATCVSTGNSLGYANTTLGPPCPGGPYSGGINPSLALELDIFDNNQANTCIAELANDHWALVQNGNFVSPILGPANINGGTGIVAPAGTVVCHTLRIVYSGGLLGNALAAFWDGNPLFGPVIYDMTNNTFGGNPNVYFGFTASTGGLNVTQNVCFEFSEAGRDTAICDAATLQLQGSGGTSYAWTPAANLTGANTATPTFNPPGPGTTFFALQTTNAFGCVDRDTVVVVTEANPTATAGANAALCLGDSVQLGTTPAANVTYQWSPAAGLSDPTLANPWAQPTATTTYTVTVTSTTGVAACSSTASVTVTVNPVPTADAGADITICDNTCGNIGAAPVAGLTYAWTPATDLSATNVANPVACPDVNMNYFLTVTDPATSCFSRDTVLVTVNPAPTANAGPDLDICPGTSITLQGSNVGGSQFAWSPPAGLSASNVLQPSASPTSTTTYTLTVTNPTTGCLDTDDMVLTVNPADSLDIQTLDQTICNTGSVSISTYSDPGINAWSWTPATGLSATNIANPTASPSVTTEYFLTGTNTTSGCTYTDSLTITVYRLNVSSFTDTVVCVGDTLRFDPIVTNGSGTYGYLWTGSPVSADTIRNPFAVIAATSNDYILTILDSVSLCTEVVTIHVDATRPVATVSPAYRRITAGHRVQLIGTGGPSWLWTPAATLDCDECPNPVAQPSVTTTYTLTVTDTNGCRNFASALIEVDSLIVPNVLTPNGDGMNDVWAITYDGIHAYRTFIYDRWGNLIFSTTDPQVNWDGTTNSGAAAPDGVYYLVMYLEGDYGIPKESRDKTYSITLLR